MVVIQPGSQTCCHLFISITPWLDEASNLHKIDKSVVLACYLTGSAKDKFLATLLENICTC